MPAAPSLNINKLILRPVIGADLEVVLRIERAVQVNPWSRLSFEQSLNQGHICRLVEHEGEILAFHIVCPILDELHILNLAVASNQHGNGLGHVLLDDILRQAKHSKAKKVFLEVRESNLIAQSLYQKWQFKQIAMRKNYYSAGANAAANQATQGGTREDALVMVRQLD